MAQRVYETLLQPARDDAGAPLEELASPVAGPVR